MTWYVWLNFDLTYTWQPQIKFLFQDLKKKYLKCVSGDCRYMIRKDFCAHHSSLIFFLSKWDCLLDNDYFWFHVIGIWAWPRWANQQSDIGRWGKVWSCLFCKMAHMSSRHISVIYIGPRNKNHHSVLGFRWRKMYLTLFDLYAW